MTAKEAIESIRAPKGTSTIMGAVLNESYDPIQSPNACGLTLKQAEHNYHIALEKRNNCGSDWAYWGYQGDVSYWSAVVDILKAVELVGENKLPDIRLNSSRDKCVMNACADIEEFGRKILKETMRKMETQNDR